MTRKLVIFSPGFTNIYIIPLYHLWPQEGTFYTSDNWTLLLRHKKTPKPTEL